MEKELIVNVSPRVGNCKHPDDHNRVMRVLNQKEIKEILDLPIETDFTCQQGCYLKVYCNHQRAGVDILYYPILGEKNNSGLPAVRIRAACTKTTCMLNSGLDGK